jgi:hypothetical protein
MRSKPGSTELAQTGASQGNGNRGEVPGVIRALLNLLRADSERIGKIKFWFTWGFLFIVGLALATWDTWCPEGWHAMPKFFQNLLWKGGEAILIAQLLAFLVDQTTKQRLLNEFANAVSTHIIGRRLPTGLRKHIERYLEADLIRTTWTITYTITEWPSQPEYVQLVTLSVYEIANRSDFEQKFPCIYRIEKSFFPNIGDAEILHVTGTNLLNPKDSFDYPKQPELEPKKTASDITFSHEVMIPVHNKDEAAYRFSMESNECFHYGSIDPFFSFYPVLSTTLTVFYPIASMKVDVELSFGDIETDAELITLSNGSEWVFKKPMLSGQGFSVRFSKLPPVIPTSAPVIPTSAPVIPASPPVIATSDKV